MFLHSPGAFIEFERGETEQSISDRFEKQVERFPDSLAIKTRNHRLTYRELNPEANRVVGEHETIYASAAWNRIKFEVGMSKLSVSYSE